MPDQDVIVSTSLQSPRTSHYGLFTWINEVVALCTPDIIYWCNGSKEEYELLMTSKEAMAFDEEE